MDAFAERRWPDVTCRLHKGAPTLLRDGAPWFGWGAERPIVGEHREIFQHLGGCGLRQFHVDATCSEDIYHPELRFWHGPGKFDGSFQDAYFRHILEACPDILLQLRIYVGAPEWWLDAHPDQLQTYHDGASSRTLQRAGERRLPSLASPLWRRDITEALRAYVAWLEDAGWSKQVSALFIGYGITWEWALLGSDGFLDYSVHAQAYFREWLAKKYGTDESLSRAWGRDIEIEHAGIPSAERRARRGGAGGLRRIPEEQDVMDHQQSLSDMNADVLLQLAAAAKEASRNEAVVGAFYGYTLTAREQAPFTGLYGAGGFVGGHHALGRVLGSDHVDFLASPFSYADRELGSGLLIEHVPLASLQAHGKAFFDENDLYPHTNQAEGDDRAASISVGVARTPDESIKYLRLAFMQAIVRGKHQWFTELTGWVGKIHDNFNDGLLLAEISRLNALADPLVSLDRSAVAQIAFIIDESSVARLTLDHTAFRDAIYFGSTAWGHTGAPFDILLLEDLLAAPSGKYRLAVPACVKLPEQIALLREWKGTHPEVHFWWDNTENWYPPASASALVRQMTAAGVHRYIEDETTVWANASMVGIHVSKPGTRHIRFRGACRGEELFSGQPFIAESGCLEWTFEKNDVALFIIR
jgi:Beta-galactosidase